MTNIVSYFIAWCFCPMGALGEHHRSEMKAVKCSETGYISIPSFLFLFSCNLEKPQAAQGAPGPRGPPEIPASGAEARWNNETSKTSKDAPVAADARDFKRVHFSLETLNTRRLLARLAGSEAKVGGAIGDTEEHIKSRAEPISSLCENGGPAASLASLVLSLPSSSSAKLNAPPPVAKAPPLAVVTSAPVPTAPPTAAPPQPGELQELQEQIEQMREKLRVALARRAEIQTSLSKPETPPTITTETSLSPNRKSVTTMTDPHHKVLSKVQTLHSRLSNQRRWWHDFL